MLTLLSFVDRDMVMRFRGGGVGHKTTRKATRCFSEDVDVLDERDRMDDDSEEAEETVIASQSLDVDTDGSEAGGEELGSESSSSDGEESEDDPVDEYNAEGYAEL